VPATSALSLSRRTRTRQSYWHKPTMQGSPASQSSWLNNAGTLAGKTPLGVPLVVAIGVLLGRIMTVTARLIVPLHTGGEGMLQVRIEVYLDLTYRPNQK
jgi:hypothetical protein